MMQDFYRHAYVFVERGEKCRRLRGRFVGVGVGVGKVRCYGHDGFGKPFT